MLNYAFVVLCFLSLLTMLMTILGIRSLVSCVIDSYDRTMVPFFGLLFASSVVATVFVGVVAWGS